MALYNRTLPHWSGPAYFSLILFASFMLMEYQKKTTKVLVSLGTGIFVLVIALGLFQGQTGMLIQDLNKKKFETGKKDFTIDLAMWDEMGSTLKKYIFDEEEDENFGILTHNWFPAAHLDYYFAVPNQRKLIVHGDANRLHEYMRINKIRGGIEKGENYLWITTSHYFGAPDQKILDQFEDYSTNPDIIPVKSGSKIRVNLLIWKLIRAKG